jgi:hypothetical protein
MNDFLRAGGSTKTAAFAAFRYDVHFDHTAAAPFKVIAPIKV